MEAIVKIKDISIKNIKNVGLGKLSFPYSKKDDSKRQSEVVGIYGQNGSGKSALINAIHILKTVMSGQSLEPEFCDYIHFRSNKAEFSFSFSITKGEKVNLEVFYDFTMEKGVKGIPVIKYEKLSYKDLSESKSSKIKIIETVADNNDKTFVPLKNHNALIKKISGI